MLTESIMEIPNELDVDKLFPHGEITAPSLNQLGLAFIRIPDFTTAPITLAGGDDQVDNDALEVRCCHSFSLQL